MSLVRHVGAGVCLMLAGLSAYWAAAELIAIGPRALMTDAESSRTLLKQTDWQAAYKLMETSLSIKPGDAGLQFDAGRMAWWQGLYVADQSEDKRQWLAAAELHLKSAITERPTWGRAWAELANIYLQQRDFGNARLALNKAMVMEPYEATSQWMVFWTGFALWPTLLPEDRDLLLVMARAALANKSYSWVIDPAVKYRHEYMISELVAGNAAAQGYMRQRVRAREHARSGRGN